MLDRSEAFRAPILHVAVVVHVVVVVVIVVSWARETVLAAAAVKPGGANALRNETQYKPKERRKRTSVAK